MNENGVGVLLHLSPEEAGNLLALINKAQITGAEALVTVLLQQRIQAAIADFQDRQKVSVEET